MCPPPPRTLGRCHPSQTRCGALQQARRQPPICWTLRRPTPSQEKMRISLVDADLTKHSLGKLAPPAELLGGKAAEHHPLWPASDALPGYKATILDYFTAVSALSDELLKVRWPCQQAIQGSSTVAVVPAARVLLTWAAAGTACRRS